MTPSQRITAGAWAARWGDWQVYVRQTDSGWSVAVWEWPFDKPLESRKLLERAVGLRDAETAINWASSKLKEQGARVFVSGREQPLTKFLSFTPAPEAVP